MTRRDWLRGAAMCGIWSRWPATSAPNLALSGFAVYSCPVGSRPWVLLEVQTEQGLTGLGDATAGGTGPGGAARVARSLLEHMRGRSPFEIERLRRRPEGERVLILLTDGASNAGEVAPVKAAELAANDGIRIYTIGVGADEMQMPGLFGVFGSRLVNPSADLDEDTLNAVAAATGGRYFRARDSGKLQEIYGIIDALEPIEQDPETYRPTAALYQWPMALAWLLICLLALLQWRSPSWAQHGRS